MKYFSLGLLFIFFLFPMDDFGKKFAFGEAGNKPEDILDNPEINKFIQGVAKVTAQAEINLPTDNSENPEAGIKIFSIGRNQEGELVVQAALVGIGHHFDYSSIVYPDTIAIAHTHYHGILRIPHGADDDPLNFYGIPSYIISPEGGDIWVIGRIDGKLKFKNVSLENPSDWIAYPSWYEVPLWVMSEKAGGGPYSKDNLVLIFGKPNGVKYKGSADLPNGGFFWGGWHEVTFNSYEILYGKIKKLKGPINLTASHGGWISNFGEIYVLLKISEENPQALFWGYASDPFCIPPEVRQEFSLDPWLEKEIRGKVFKISCQ